MKIIYALTAVYTLIMTVGLFVTHTIFHIAYGHPQFLYYMLPTFFALLVFTVYAYKKYGIKISDTQGRYRLFLIIFIPVAALGLWALVHGFTLSLTYVLPIIGALLVGINEELFYRGVVFTRILQAKGYIPAVFISALLFSLLHSVNIVAGMPALNMLQQLFSTFLSGLFFACIYYYTRNLVFLVIYHTLWDYTLLSGLSQQFWYVSQIFILFIVAELVITQHLLRKTSKTLKHGKH